MGNRQRVQVHAGIGDFVGVFLIGRSTRYAQRRQSAYAKLQVLEKCLPESRAVLGDNEQICLLQTQALDQRNRDNRQRIQSRHWQADRLDRP